MLVLHNLDEQTTQAYDLKLSEFDQPILKSNLKANHDLIATKFFSDVFLAEDVPKDSENNNELF